VSNIFDFTSIALIYNLTSIISYIYTWFECIINGIVLHYLEEYMTWYTCTHTLHVNTI